jgi:hypothetical protein
MLKHIINQIYQYLYAQAYKQVHNYWNYIFLHIMKDKMLSGLPSINPPTIVIAENLAKFWFAAQ